LDCLPPDFVTVELGREASPLDYAFALSPFNYGRTVTVELRFEASPSSWAGNLSPLNYGFGPLRQRQEPKPSPLNSNFALSPLSYAQAVTVGLGFQAKTGGFAHRPSLLNYGFQASPLNSFRSSSPLNSVRRFAVAPWSPRPSPLNYETSPLNYGREPISHGTLSRQPHHNDVHATTP
jgi:hypothetical protein